MKLSGKNKVSPDFSMASMTDIVFLLLIFFMITSTTVQNSLKVSLPSAKGNTSQKETTTVSINEEGRYFVGETEYASDKLEQAIKQTLSSIKDSTFIISADENAKHKEVVYLMSLAKKNNYNIVIATDPKDESN